MTPLTLQKQPWFLLSWKRTKCKTCFIASQFKSTLYHLLKVCIMDLGVIHHTEISRQTPFNILVQSYLCMCQSALKCTSGWKGWAWRKQNKPFKDAKQSAACRGGGWSTSVALEPVVAWLSCNSLFVLKKTCAFNLLVSIRKEGNSHRIEGKYCAVCGSEWTQWPPM